MAAQTSPIHVGREAPDFSLPDQDGKTVQLSDFRDRWVVLYFYPKDDTPGCTTEACEFSEGLKAFEDLDAVVLGVSPDSPDSHREFIAKHDLRLRLLSDPQHKVMAQYGAYGEKTQGGKTSPGVTRSTVLIDPDGRVAHHWPTVKAEGHADQVRRKLAELCVPT